MINIIIIGLGAWRIARFITHDVIFKKFFDKIRKQKKVKMLAYLFSCMFCLTFWTSLGLWFAPSWLQDFLAVWAIATLLSYLEWINMYMGKRIQILEFERQAIREAE